MAVLIGYWAALRSGWKPPTDDYLALMTIVFLAFLVSGCFRFLGRQTMRSLAFPIAFLIFMVPFPSFLIGWIETFLQHGSAFAAAALFKVSGMPLFQRGLEFHLPGFSMQVAPQCSGIHSTLVLFITSLLAGHLLLSRHWSRAVLLLVVIPLAMLRNGFRIFVIGQLCVRISPEMIDSYIHRRGGPIFFILSLVPFFILLLFLRKRETRSRRGIEADLTL
jgi:exosortase C (VPDSG-CTERM-specific)